MNIYDIVPLKQYEILSGKLKSFKVFTKDFVWACYSMQTTKSVCFSWHIISWFDLWFRIYKTFKNVFLTKYCKWYICHRLWKWWYIYVHFCLYWNKRAITVWNISLLYNLLYHYSDHIDLVKKNYNYCKTENLGKYWKLCNRNKFHSNFTGHKVHLKRVCFKNERDV